MCNVGSCLIDRSISRSLGNCGVIRSNAEECCFCIPNVKTLLEWRNRLVRIPFHYKKAISISLYESTVCQIQWGMSLTVKKPIEIKKGSSFGCNISVIVRNVEFLRSNRSFLILFFTFGCVIRQNAVAFYFLVEWMKKKSGAIIGLCARRHFWPKRNVHALLYENSGKIVTFSLENCRIFSHSELFCIFFGCEMLSIFFLIARTLLIRLLWRFACKASFPCANTFLT